MDDHLVKEVKVMHAVVCWVIHRYIERVDAFFNETPETSIDRTSLAKLKKDLDKVTGDLDKTFRYFMVRRSCETCGRVGSCDDEDDRMCFNYHLWVPKPDIDPFKTVNSVAMCPEHGMVEPMRSR